MSKAEVKQEAQNPVSTFKSVKFSDISSDLKRLKERPESRRGPFVISDDDINDQFDLDNDVICD